MAEEQSPSSKADDSLEKMDPATTSPEGGNSTPPPEGVTAADQDPKAYVVPGSDAPVERKNGGFNLARRIITRINIYLLAFILVLVAAGAVVGGSYISQRTKTVIEDEKAINAQELNEGVLKDLNGAEVKLGDPKQILTVESNSIFSGKVLIRDSVDIAGSLNLGGALSLPSLTVTGVTQFNNIQANTLELSGNATISGTLDVQQDVTISGATEFGGPINVPQITVSTLILNQDLRINGHLDVNGATPRVVSGTGVGSGGTASISGSDTSGTVTINTGGGPPAGVLATITFAAPYTEVPRVVITPVGSGGATIAYYVIRNQTSFSIATATPAPVGTSFSFDYFVTQ